VQITAEDDGIVRTLFVRGKGDMFAKTLNTFVDEIDGVNIAEILRRPRRLKPASSAHGVIQKATRGEDRYTT
jgi:hypothetical protein